MAGTHAWRAAMGLSLILLASPLVGCFNDSDTSDSTDSPGSSPSTPLLWSTTPLTGPPGGPPPSTALCTDAVTYPSGHPLSRQCTDPAITGPEDQLFTQITQYRLTLPAPPPPTPPAQLLIHDPTIRECERANAMHFTIEPYFALVNPEGDTPGDRMTTLNIAWTQLGTRIEQGPPDAQALLSLWLTDPFTKQIIEDSNWTRIGCGHAISAGQVTQWSVIFAY